jgi:hypothetical protein
VLERCREVWKEHNKDERREARKERREARLLSPINLHECCHTCATWLDHAGVSPKVVSEWMGHATPRRQAGAAPITLNRYTHVLPGELEKARDQLDAFLAERAGRHRRCDELLSPRLSLDYGSGTRKRRKAPFARSPKSRCVAADSGFPSPLGTGEGGHLHRLPGFTPTGGIQISCPTAAADRDA